MPILSTLGLNRFSSSQTPLFPRNPLIQSMRLLYQVSLPFCWIPTVPVVVERAVRSGWREKIMQCILGIFVNNLYLLPVVRRIGNHVLLGVSLGLTRRMLMLHSAYIKKTGQLVFFGQWNRLTILQRMRSLRHDGGAGYDIIMTTSLSSDVPVGYFSWSEYDIMAPVHPKTEKALAAAFISNCAARNFRLQALKGLESSNVKIDSYGSCHGNRNGNVDKVKTLKRYKFSLAFENANEEDYVTEKFFQSLVAGTVPIVVGAPNIQDFAPSPGSVLHIKELTDLESVVKMMKQLAENPTAYNESLRWKYDGPSDSFKALVDMSAVHSSCRLCIFLASRIREEEEKSPTFPKRPCKCRRGSETVHHVYVRERGRFEMESIFLRSGNLTIEALESAVLSKFKSVEHETIWRNERPESIRGDEKELKVYRIYPVGMTQRQALYKFSFKANNNSFRSHILSNPCAKFEAIFV